MQDFQAYVINLESRVDRREQMARQLAMVGWEAEFFPAVRPDDAGGFETIGARGCFMSHLNVLRKAAAQDRHVIVLEDDLNFSDRFDRLWPAAAENLSPTAWSIFYPGHLLQDVSPGLHFVDSKKGLWCTHFMVVHKQSISTIVSALDTILSRPPGHPLGGPMHVDAAYNLIRHQNPKLSTCIYSPVLGYQRASRSDVSVHRWYDRIKPLRPVIDFMRQFKKHGRHGQTDNSL